MADLKTIHEDYFFKTLLGYFQGNPVRFQVNKINGEIKISADDAARCLGFDTLNDLLATDHGLDVISDFKKDHPDRPVFGEPGSGAMFESTTM